MTHWQKWPGVISCKMSATDSIVFQWAKYAANCMKKYAEFVEIWLYYDKWVIVVDTKDELPSSSFNIPIIAAHVFNAK